VEIRVRITLRRQLSEAVFANAALIVEGDSDAGLLHGLADRGGGFDALGIAVVNGQSKRQVLIPWAILAELGVPTYVIFDGDGGLAERQTQKGRPYEDAQRVQREAQAENEIVLRALGATPERAPTTTIGANFTRSSRMPSRPRPRPKPGSGSPTRSKPYARNLATGERSLTTPIAWQLAGYRLPRHRTFSSSWNGSEC